MFAEESPPMGASLNGMNSEKGAYAQSVKNS
jgi:hypothetical protein